MADPWFGILSQFLELHLQCIKTSPSIKTIQLLLPLMFIYGYSSDRNTACNTPSQTSMHQYILHPHLYLHVCMLHRSVVSHAIFSFQPLSLVFFLLRLPHKENLRWKLTRADYSVDSCGLRLPERSLCTGNSSRCFTADHKSARETALPKHCTV